MEKERLTMFSDGVIAIIITIMVLELKAPHSAEPAALLALAPVFLSYVLSFVYVAIYWNNHHHMLQTLEKVNGRILWANMHLLFWLSLIPFATAWMGENHFAAWPSAVYGVALLMPALAYNLLQRTIIHVQGKNTLLAQAVGADIKGRLSPVLYMAGVGLAFVNPLISNGIYLAVALWWLIPDRRIEEKVNHTV